MTAWVEEQEEALGGAWRVQLYADRVLYQADSEHQDILLFENTLSGRVLMIDGVVQTTERDEFYYHEMLVHVPVLTHGAARRALIIGGGDGGALEELLKHDGIEQVTMVEIDGAVVDFAKEYLRPICGEAFEDPRLELVIADGVDWVKSAAGGYDLAFIDGTDALDQGGPGDVLYTAEFYRDCAGLLAEGGLLVSQNAVPFTEPKALRGPVRNLKSAFDATACYRVAVPSFYGGDMVFALASADENRLRPTLETLARRFQDAGLDTRYYTPEVHLGALALPPCIAALID